MIVIERLLDEPVYEQIARQIRQSVASGALSPGTKLPTVRVLASDLGVNLNTVARAYWLLEEEGFIRIHDRSGAEVVAPARKPTGDREKLLQELRTALARLRQAGHTREDLRRIVDREMDCLSDARD